MQSPDALAAEMAAFANSDGSVILLGVANDGSLPGLSRADVSRLNQMISNVAVQHVRSPLRVHTDNVALEHGRLVADFYPSACYTDTRAWWYGSHTNMACSASPQSLVGQGERGGIPPMELRIPSPLHPSVLSRLLDPVGRCLTPEVARQPVALQADPAV